MFTAPDATLPGPAARPSPPARAETPSPGAHRRWVLLVGAALRPDAVMARELARDGIRCIWRDSTEQAARTAQLAHFDAACVDTTTLGPAARAVVQRLRRAVHAPLLVVGSGQDSREELDALGDGADLFLARPLPSQRLCAHLLALLRRSSGARAAAAEKPRGAHPPQAMALLQGLLGGMALDNVADLEGSLSLRATRGDQGLELTIRELRVNLR